MNQPLKDIVVVDLTLYAAGPMCSRLLADWGAKVIKIEPLGGEPTRFGRTEVFWDFHNCNANKYSLTLDLKMPEGIQALHRLLSQADIFVSNYRVKALSRLGLGYEELHEKYPKLIYAVIDAYGSLGPEADAPGFDSVAFWARTGMLGDYVEPGSPVLRPPFAFGDTATGCMLAGGICAALHQRDVTGVGNRVMTSLYNMAIFLQTSTLLDIQDGTIYPKSRKAPDRPLNGTYLCKDGVWLMLAALDHERHYNLIMEIIGRKDLCDSPRYNTLSQAKTHVTELVDILDNGFAKLPFDYVAKKLSEKDIPFSRVCKTVDILTDPQALANEYIYDCKFADGSSYMLPAPPIRYGTMERSAERLAPKLGEHSIEILSALGYHSDEIQDMLQRQITSSSNQIHERSS